MFLSGCMSSDKVDVEADEESKTIDITASLNVSEITEEIAVNDIVIIEGVVEISPTETKRNYEFDLISTSGIRTIEATLNDYGDNVRLIFVPDEPGEWTVNIRMIIDGVNDSIKKQVSFDVITPD